MIPIDYTRDLIVVNMVINPDFQLYEFDLIARRNYNSFVYSIELILSLFVRDWDISMVSHRALRFDWYDYVQDLNVVDDSNFSSLRFWIFDYLGEKFEREMKNEWLFFTIENKFL